MGVKKIFKKLIKRFSFDKYDIMFSFQKDKCCICNTTFYYFLEENIRFEGNNYCNKCLKINENKIGETATDILEDKKIKLLNYSIKHVKDIINVLYFVFLQEHIIFILSIEQLYLFSKLLFMYMYKNKEFENEIFTDIYFKNIVTMNCLIQKKECEELYINFCKLHDDYINKKSKLDIEKIKSNLLF